MFGKFGQQVVAIVCTLLVSTAALTAAVGPATATSQFGSQSVALARGAVA